MVRGCVIADGTRDGTGGVAGDGGMSDGGRGWLPHREIGKALGIEAASAKRLFFRRRWPHRAGNDGIVRVGVPVAEPHRATGYMRHVISGDA